jgi:hypothetical protein
MFCLLSGCTLKRVYYPAYVVGYDMYGNPIYYYDYYYVNLDDPNSAKNAQPYIIQQPPVQQIVVQQTPQQTQQTEKNSGKSWDCNCNH